MKISVTVLLATLALPTFADTPPAAKDAAPVAKEAEPASNQDDTAGAELGLKFLERIQAGLAKMTPEELTRLASFPPQRNCYFIRQVNQNLQKPKATPELLPLAASAAPIQNSDTTCLTDSILRKAVAK